MNTCHPHRNRVAARAPAAVALALLASLAFASAAQADRLAFHMPSDERELRAFDAPLPADIAGVLAVLAGE